MQFRYTFFFWRQSQKYRKTFLCVCRLSKLLIFLGCILMVLKFIDIEFKQNCGYFEHCAVIEIGIFWKNGISQLILYILNKKLQHYIWEYIFFLLTELDAKICWSCHSQCYHKKWTLSLVHISYVSNLKYLISSCEIYSYRTQRIYFLWTQKLRYKPIHPNSSQSISNSLLKQH